MTPEQFTYWLQGFAELNPTTPPTAEQWKSICEHLSTVFVKVTPPLTQPQTPNPPDDVLKRWHEDAGKNHWVIPEVTCQGKPTSYC